MKARILGIFAVIMLLSVFLFSRGFDRNQILVFATLDTLDIQWVHVEQYNGTHWNEVENFTSDGGSERILDSQKINFTVEVNFNKTLAANIGLAQTYTRVNGTIGIGSDHSIWNNEPLNVSATYQDDADYWYVWFCGNWTSSLPVGGSTYNCTFVYQAYY